MSRALRADELAEATAHGGLYLRRLIRAQLGLSLLALVAFGGSSARCRSRCYLLPGLQDVFVLGVPLPILIIAWPPFPFFIAIAVAVRAPGGRARGGVPRPRGAAAIDRARARSSPSPAATIGLGIYGVRFARTTSDLFVASRAITPWWNAAAISGEYLSAASFLGIAGLQMKLGSGALWLPLGFTAGYLALLLFVAAPLRRFGAYTISDFAEARLGSPRLRAAGGGRRAAASPASTSCRSSRAPG